MSSQNQLNRIPVTKDINKWPQCKMSRNPDSGATPGGTPQWQRCPWKREWSLCREEASPQHLSVTVSEDCPSWWVRQKVAGNLDAPWKGQIWDHIGVVKSTCAHHIWWPTGSLPHSAHPALLGALLATEWPASPPNLWKAFTEADGLQQPPGSFGDGQWATPLLQPLLGGS